MRRLLSSLTDRLAAGLANLLASWAVRLEMARRQRPACGPAYAPARPDAVVVFAPCPWCDAYNPLTASGPDHCRRCGHRSDLPRQRCGCPLCLSGPAHASGRDA